MLLLVFPQPGGSGLPRVLQVGVWCKCASEQLLWLSSKQQMCFGGEAQECLCICGSERAVVTAGAGNREFPL